MDIQNKVFPDFLSGGGEMGERIRNFDWTKTPLGPPEKWEQSLKTCVRIMLTSSQPIWIGWGAKLIKLYNDPYKAIVGGKHPEALGLPASVVWRDIWNDIEPMLKRVMEDDEGTYAESQLLIMERNHYAEETYYTFSYTPIPGDHGGTAGMICANTDDTARIINERALQTLRDIGKLSYEEKSIDKIYSRAAEVLFENTKDFPFALFYEISESNHEARAVAWSGAKEEYHAFPTLIDIQTPTPGTQPMYNAVHKREIIITDNDGEISYVPRGAWHIPPKQFLYIPLSLANDMLPAAILMIGLNPFRKYDSAYQQFIQLFIDQLSLEINNMHALEVERKRAEALAEIDKAKTVFFNNISHEFRTPLTLMLGPLEELMHLPESEISRQNQFNIETTHRNAQRLLKLVNALLDFSRVESGRQVANFTQVNIYAYTKNLVSSFRSVIEKAGMQLTVETKKIEEPVFVDKVMWEKIIFNLLSNAFKYTLEGSIRVQLFQDQHHVILEVADTGVGIPEKEIPHMFERFHRVKEVVGRSYEGTGIGLSMIKEFVHLHGGTITVASKQGEGSTFRVSIPTGRDHLRSSQISTSESADDIISNRYVEEARTLLQEAVQRSADMSESDKKKEIILVVDDNADMREYIKTLLQKQYQVVLAVNGKDALEKLTEVKPTLILSDVMMPVMDGIELLKEVKKNPVTERIPLILLSARAGEESRIEGYEIGADDYLIKPFSAKELLARIRAQVKMAATRQHTENQLRNLFLQAPVAICIFRGPQYVVEVANEKMLALWGKSAGQVINKPVFEGVPEVAKQGYEELLESVYITGKRFVAAELPATVSRDNSIETIYVKFVYEPLYEENGSISGVMALADDITEQVLSRKKIEQSEQLFRVLAETLPQLVWQTDEKGISQYASKRWQDYTGVNPKGLEEWIRVIHPDDVESNNDAWAHSLATGNIYKCDVRLKSGSGEYRWFRVLGEPVYDNEDRIIKWVGAFTDIHAEKSFSEELQKQVDSRTRELAKANYALEQQNKELEKMNSELQSFNYISSHDLQEPLRKIQTFASRIVDVEKENLSARGIGYLVRMQDAALRMRQLIDDLLSYSRASTAERQFVATDLRKIVEEVVSELHDDLKQRNGKVEIDIACDLEIIPFQFRQLMANLIGNAIKFSRDNVPLRIKISCKIQPGSHLTEKRLNAEQPYAHLMISDNGIGFEPEFNLKIFELFQRLNPANYRGTGIGLAIVKKIVENHHGLITANGKLNEGATFNIYIPVR